MVSLLVYLKTKSKVAELVALSRELIAQMSEEYWEIKHISDATELNKYLEKNPLINLIVYDVRDSSSMEELRMIRRQYKQSRIMIIADTAISPMEYIRPDLQISSLLLKPWTQQQAYAVFYDFFGEYLEFCVKERNYEDSIYRIETKEGTINIPYEQICFFEAREKKVYVCLGKEEYGFYSTIDKLAETLPDYFVRCHRSFIVNTKKIRKIVLSQNMLYLHDGFTVPLSRSYKTTLKEIGKR